MRRGSPPGGWPKKPAEHSPINSGSKCQTPTTLLIDVHYARLRIWERWSWERFSRLAKFLNVTAAELASVACIPHKVLPDFEARNRLFVGRQEGYAAALLLTLIEANACREFTKDVIESPFPNLSPDAQPEGT